ncbi:MAG: hypothetical protein ACI9YG_001271, partial [Candidatus Azotimanducaceae bacterium]
CWRNPSNDTLKSHRLPCSPRMRQTVLPTSEHLDLDEAMRKEA